MRCVEITEAGISECSNSLSTEVGSSLVGQSMNRENHRTKAKRQIDLKCLNMTPITLEQHLESVRKGLNNLIGATPEGSYQSSSMRDLSKSQGLTLQRSKSCRSILMTSPDWFQELEQNNCTPPTRCLKDFPGRPEGLQRRPLALNYDAESEVLSVEESLISEQSTSINNTKGSKNASEANFTTISEFATELKEMAQVQYQNLRDVGQV